MLLSIGDTAVDSVDVVSAVDAVDAVDVDVVRSFYLMLLSIDSICVDGRRCYRLIVSVSMVDAAINRFDRSVFVNLVRTTDRMRQNTGSN
jgi:hypothetical protein